MHSLDGLVPGVGRTTQARSNGTGSTPLPASTLRVVSTRLSKAGNPERLFKLRQAEFDDLSGRMRVAHTREATTCCKARSCSSAVGSSSASHAHTGAACGLSSHTFALGAEDQSLRLRFGSQVDDFNAAVVLAPLVGDVGIHRARLSKADRLEPHLIDAGVCKIVLHHFCTTL